MRFVEAIAFSTLCNSRTFAGPGVGSEAAASTSASTLRTSPPQFLFESPHGRNSPGRVRSSPPVCAVAAGSIAKDAEPVIQVGAKTGPASVHALRSRLVAAIRRDVGPRSSGSHRCAQTFASCSSRRIFPCVPDGMSPISSRKMVPSIALLEFSNAAAIGPRERALFHGRTARSPEAPRESPAQLIARKGARTRWLCW